MLQTCPLQAHPLAVIGCAGPRERPPLSQGVGVEGAETDGESGRGAGKSRSRWQGRADLSGELSRIPFAVSIYVGPPRPLPRQFSDH